MKKHPISDSTHSQSDIGAYEAQNQKENSSDSRENRRQRNDARQSQNLPAKGPKPAGTPSGNYRNRNTKPRTSFQQRKTLPENAQNKETSIDPLWKANLLANTKIISNEEECQHVIDFIMSTDCKKCDNNQISDDLSGNDWPFTEDKVVVGLDCEGVNLGFRGKVTLIQIASTSGITYIFDVFACPSMVDGGLKTLLESPDIIKVIHACPNDAVNLYKQFDITLATVFDTQSAHTVLQYQKFGTHFDEVKRIGLNGMFQQYGTSINPLKDGLKNVYKHDQAYWSRRPLTEEMTLYASADVANLVDDKLYYFMCKSILPENRSIMVDLCEEQIFYNILPKAIYLKQNLRFAEREVAQLKIKLTRVSENLKKSNKGHRLLKLLAKSSTISQ